MDEKRLTELGVTHAPEPELSSLRSRPEIVVDTLARLAVATNDTIVLGAAVGTDTVDRKRYTIYVGDGDLPLGVDNYLKPEMQKIRDGYVRTGGRLPGHRRQYAGGRESRRRKRILAIESASPARSSRRWKSGIWRNATRRCAMTT